MSSDCKFYVTSNMVMIGEVRERGREEREREREGRRGKMGLGERGETGVER